VAAVALVASNAPVAAMARDFGEAQAPPPTPAEVADAARDMHSMLLTGYGLSEHRQLLLADLREAPLTIRTPRTCFWAPMIHHNIVYIMMCIQNPDGKFSGGPG
jgi:hypothetical protein